jgi:hypothetical protein
VKEIIKGEKDIDEELTMLINWTPSNHANSNSYLTQSDNPGHPQCVMGGSLEMLYDICKCQSK